MTKIKVHTNCKIIFGSGSKSKDRYDIVLLSDLNDKINSLNKEIDILQSISSVDCCDVLEKAKQIINKHFEVDK